MANPTKKKILIFLTIILTITITLYYIHDSFHYYYPLSEYLAHPKQHTQQCNIIGKVGKIISSNKNHIHFTIYDSNNKKSQLNIIYKGTVPRMFSIHQEVIATGIMSKNNQNKNSNHHHDRNHNTNNNANNNNTDNNRQFIASRILVKHDETYSPYPQKK